MDDQTTFNQNILSLAKVVAILAAQIRIYRDGVEIAHIKMHPKYEPQFRRFEPLLERLQMKESQDAGEASIFSSSTPLSPQTAEALKGILEQVRILRGAVV